MAHKKIMSDGNYLFGCFAFHHYGSQRFHQKVRTEIIIYVVQNWVDFESFIEGDQSYGRIISYQENTPHISVQLEI